MEMSKRCVLIFFIPFHIGLYVTLTVLVAICCGLKQFAICATVGLLALLIGDFTAARGVLGTGGNTRLRCILAAEVSFLILVIILATTLAKVSVTLFLRDEMECGSAGEAVFSFALINLLFAFLVIPSLFLFLRNVPDRRIADTTSGYSADDEKL